MSQKGYYALLVSGAANEGEMSVELVRRDTVGNSYRETELVPWTTVPAVPAGSGTELSVEAVGNQLSIWVDGKEVKSVQDDAFNQGLVGFVVIGPGRAIFRNLVVKQR
jgi:hypothetical protein